MAEQLLCCELLKSQSLTQAAASHRQNGADDANVYLTEKQKELRAHKRFGSCIEPTQEIWHSHSGARQ